MDNEPEVGYTECGRIYLGNNKWKDEETGTKYNNNGQVIGQAPREKPSILSRMLNPLAQAAGFESTEDM